jgi:hypothetical protein
MTTARTGLIVFVQVVVAALFRIRGDPAPWRAQAPWWTVYATVVDVGCLLLLWRQTKRVSHLANAANLMLTGEF